MSCVERESCWLSLCVLGFRNGLSLIGSVDVLVSSGDAAAAAAALPRARLELEACERRIAATDASLKRVAEAVRALSADPDLSTAESEAGHF